MEILFVLVPLLIAAVFLIMVVTIAYQAVTGLAEWSRNNSLPVEEAHSRLVSKRTEMRGHSHNQMHGRVRTFYYATFELKDGDRHEFGLSGREYGLLAEGDQGTLTYQGTRYHGFRRVGARVVDADF
ncbi:DUF2500 domain-containing protein [Paludisphaera mucosa]|uniref:DUF2500 domain-containing protein n=1 Tax=Paludisphaera mucosa TaxID=3030827 RepID=A0ABT6F3T9_9BACT|nr:DUF2500 domain-containing protein [Paludisphaera mucosa]MDG3002253.1 DUF2500 domain-containing protein [Paludisphaera mucosa]